MAKKKTGKNKKITATDMLDQVYVTQYEITYEPIPEPAYQRLPKPVKEKIEGLYQEAQRNPQQAIPKLLRLRKKYPRIPQIYNYLAVAYSHAGEINKAENITQENIRRNPNYLFARINWAQVCLAQGEYDKIPEIFENKYDLQALYPRRKKFHISEVVNFMGVMGLYFFQTNQRDVAETYNKVLQEIASGYPIAKQLNRKLNPSIMTRILKWLLGK